MHINLLLRIQTALTILKRLGLSSYLGQRRSYHLFNQIYRMGVGSITIVLLTSWFIGMIFTFQVARELTYLNACDLVGSILTVTFLRELAPVLTAVIVTGRIGSAYTAEIASMQVTNQIDVLYVLHIDPVDYLIKPRVIACVIMLPMLNLLSLATSIASSIFISTILYHIAPVIFLTASYSSIYLWDVVYSFLKTLIFGLIIGVISCTWGLSTTGGSINVGRSTTSSVVTILLTIFMVDFCLSLLMFHNAQSLLY
uniref:ABC transporter permease n=1 Tax=Helminthora furcellata TaxID=1884666 RepID=A0A1G4NZ49_9FLOR|nr:Hypothetical protein ycf63 [Helminthora furcellata]SCW21078.1 Hypothetical protein ycf63 [Helminthora furcellata]SCW23938.1 Hypothetical protein ycf63 [Helminthora furcellata]